MEARGVLGSLPPPASRPNSMVQGLSPQREKLLLEAGSSHLIGPQRRARASLPFSMGILRTLEGWGKSVCPNTERTYWAQPLGFLG